MEQGKNTVGRREAEDWQGQPDCLRDAGWQLSGRLASPRGHKRHDGRARLRLAPRAVASASLPHRIAGGTDRHLGTAGGLLAMRSGHGIAHRASMRISET